MVREFQSVVTANQINFYDNYKAPLHAGSYRLVLQQSVTVGKEDARHYYRDQSFEVLAPRYSIDPDDVQAYFPPDGGVGDYDNVLPHVVIGARKPHRPDDFPGDDDTLPNWWRMDANGNVMLPRFTRNEDANTPVLLLDLNLDLFVKLRPARKELPLLAHIRHVNTDDKVPLDMVANGEFSVLVA